MDERDSDAPTLEGEQGDGKGSVEARGSNGSTASAVDDGAVVDGHTRLAGSVFGRVVILAVVLVGAVWIVGPNMPAGPARDDLDVLWEPAGEIGLVQDWGVFSPNPRDQSLDVRARLEYDDGTVDYWDVPDFDPIAGAYRQYRWNKWQERVRLDSRRDLWAPTAEWIAAERRVSGERPARVVLVRRWIDHEPLGSPRPMDSDWNEFEFFTWERDG